MLGEVSHYYWKKEYQSRGAPHYHVLLWIRDAPVAGVDSDETVLLFIESRITCNIPDKEKNPKLHQLVTRYQMHKCSAYRRRKRKHGGYFVTKCRLNFSCSVAAEAQIDDVDCSLKTRSRFYQLVRYENEVRVNNCNPLFSCSGRPTLTFNM